MVLGGGSGGGRRFSSRSISRSSAFNLSSLKSLPKVWRSKNLVLPLVCANPADASIPGSCEIFTSSPVHSRRNTETSEDPRTPLWSSRSHKIADVGLDLPLAQTCRLTEEELWSVPCCIALCSPCVHVDLAGLSSSSWPWEMSISLRVWDRGWSLCGNLHTAIGVFVYRSHLISLRSDL